ncbi:DUF2490 domain-containing protein [Tenacibaculum maritimum]|uniref:DUF2490 domain-containing protein n=1 Tax=Tenacibaculum maritimum TaxID=107401 RepID=UPI0012E561D6|nr:DUF2490 domain-containing protein [Tenacibaculum maritimum]MCD9580551.1 DUF2490 domain-containing protein [Tenacibaculum maritimum]MCD9634550.1 DUF2490 domain-containing protein [Tenacibaculum maritimum]CAA0181842.1 conserved exported hypothetical protein [Tenacibaculum maritimum]CAA0191934.1 conserved exported hypothetical protein [Tenacibaculum maritimum]CAA0202411.1 conserved exported hypothetical protein [Tenacibaculum maritimum]
MKKLFPILLFLLTFNSLFSQSNSEKELGVWYMYNGSHKISPKVSLKTMAHFRFFEIGDDLQQFIGRLGANYKFNKHISASLGYSYVNTDVTFQADGGDIREHRIYQDVNIKHALSSLNLFHRFRGEQRFFNSKTGNFFRYQLALNYPISKKWATYLYDEVFFDLEGEAYNQNWLGIGLRYKLSEIIKLQLGYMNITNANSEKFDRIQIGISISTDHIKRTK